MKIKLLFLAVMLGLAAGCSRPAPAPAPDWSALSISAEQQRVKKLGMEPTGPGNAAAIYLPYLKDEAPITKQSWLNNISEDMVNNPRPGDSKKLKQAFAAADDDLSKIMAASAIKDSKIWGVYWQPDPKVPFWLQKRPEYINIFKLCSLLKVRGRQYEKAGDYKAAIEQYSSDFRIGNHLTGEPDMIAYLIGVSLKSSAAGRIEKAFKAMGNDASAEAWDQYLKAWDLTHSYLKMIWLEKGYTKWPHAATERFICDQDVPPAVRLDVLTQLHYGLASKYRMLRCILIGPPRWVKSLEQEFAKESEINKMFVEQMQSHKFPLSTLRDWNDQN